MRLLYRIEGRLRELFYVLKPALRAAKREASLLRFRLAGLLDREERLRVVCALSPGVGRRLRHPAISVLAPRCPAGAAGGLPADDDTAAVHGQARDALRDDASSALEEEAAPHLARQTERSVIVGPGGEYVFLGSDELASLPATHLESMLLVAAAGDLDVALAGAAPPAADRFGPVGPVYVRSGSATAAKLVRMPAGGGGERPVVGRLVPHVTDSVLATPFAEEPVLLPPTSVRGGGEGQASPGSPPTVDVGSLGPNPLVPVRPGLRATGPWLLAFGSRSRGIVHQPVYDLHARLSDLPSVPGPPTVAFLLPYLAVGGAEKLLFDLLGGLDGIRSLIVTLEPHQAALGQTVERARQLTPYVYTLGDWLPREAHGGAVRHLLRRYEARTLMSWNGTTWFYDEAPALARDFPGLHIVNQLYNHRGGWIEHYRPSLVRAIGTHVAVNRRIAAALAERGVPVSHTRLIYHGVGVPQRPSDEERRHRREKRRRELDLPLDAVVVGTFARIHRQKRPIDVVRLARRFRDRGVVFLLVGSGPLEPELEREIAADSPPNLVRLPMRRDAERLFDALDICLLPSSYEGLPVFLLEGLARGISCVATAVGDVPALLAEGGGVLVERPGDLDALERAIEKLCDEGLRNEESIRGRARVERDFELQRFVEEYDDALQLGGRA